MNVEGAPARRVSQPPPPIPKEGVDRSLRLTKGGKRDSIPPVDDGESEPEPRLIQGGRSDEGGSFSRESSRQETRNDNERGTRLKSASERTPQEQAFLVNSRKLQREALTKIMEANPSKQGAFQSLIDRSRAYLDDEEGALEDMMVRLEMLKQQKAKNNASFFRRMLARGYGTDVSLPSEIQAVALAVQNKQKMVQHRPSLRV